VPLAPRVLCATCTLHLVMPPVLRHLALATYRTPSAADYRTSPFLYCAFIYACARFFHGANACICCVPFFPATTALIAARLIRFSPCYVSLNGSTAAGRDAVMTVFRLSDTDADAAGRYALCVGLRQRCRTPWSTIGWISSSSPRWWSYRCEHSVSASLPANASLRWFSNGAANAVCRYGCCAALRTPYCSVLDGWFAVLRSARLLLPDCCNY